MVDRPPTRGVIDCDTCGDGAMAIHYGLLAPGVARLCRRVLLRGGSFLVPGNASPWAEANIWHDPEAAQIVFEAGWPITAVGLDVTHKTLLSAALLDRLSDSGTPAGVHLH